MTPRLLLTVGTCLIAASGFAANLQPIQEQVRSTSDLVDQVADRTRFVVAQSKLESSGVAERSRQSRLENGEFCRKSESCMDIEVRIRRGKQKGFVLHHG